MPGPGSRGAGLATSRPGTRGGWALTPAQCRSRLARCPYDLCHAAGLLWLNFGVPATEVARGAGHDIAAQLKIYTHGIDWQAEAANKRITDAAGTQDAGQKPW